MIENRKEKELEKSMWEIWTRKVTRLELVQGWKKKIEREMIVKVLIILSFSFNNRCYQHIFSNEIFKSSWGLADNKLVDEEPS